MREHGLNGNGEVTPEDMDVSLGPDGMRAYEEVTSTRSSTPSGAPPPVEERSVGSGPGPRGVREESCVVIGPAGSGKTCTLAALDPACYAGPVDERFQLSIRHDVTVDPQSLLSHYIVEWIAHGAEPPATESRRDFNLEVATRIRGIWPRRTELVVTTIRCTDSPGGLLVPARADLARRGDEGWKVSEVLEQAAAATSIVLVIDSTEPAADLVELHLGPLLDRMAKSMPGEELPQPLEVHVLDRLRRLAPRRGARRSRLSASRFLILLTKIDELALDLSRQLKEQGVEASPLAVADAIDPVALARERIGERNLRRIWAALGRGAQLAVGISSVTGFIRDAGGQTFLEWSTGRDAYERLGAWSTYGVYEALRFITTGRCGGPVQGVHAESDLVTESAVPLDSFPFGR